MKPLFPLLAALALSAQPAAAGPLESGLEALAKQAGVELSVGAVNRPPGGGVRLLRVSVAAPGLKITLPEARLRLRWTTLMRRRFEADLVEIPSMSIELAPSTGTAVRREGASSSWSVSARSIRVGRADLRWSRGGRGGEISAADLVLSYAADRLDMKQGRIFIAASTGSLSGWALAGGAALDARMSFRGRLRGSLRLARSGAGWSVAGSPSWDAIAFTLKGDVSPDGAWTARVALDSSKGLSAAASARWSAGLGSAEGKLAGLGTSGDLSFNFSPTASSGSWRLAGANADFSPLGLDLSFAAAASTGFAERAAGDWRFEASARADGIRRASTTVDSFSASVAGVPGDHVTRLAVEALGVRLSAQGRGSWTRDAWTARWSSARLGKWSARPFETLAAPGRLELAGVDLSSGEARAAVSLRYARGRVDAAAALTRFNLSSLPPSGTPPISVAGLLDASASLSGPASSLVGRASWTVSGLTAAGVGPGRMRCSAALSRQTVSLRDCRWDFGTAWASVSGSAPVPRGRGAADFDLLAEAGGMDGSPLTLESGGLTVEGLALESRMRLRREGGRLSASGSATARIAGARLPRWEFSVGAASAAVAAAGEVFRLSGRTTGSEDPRLELEGRAGAAGPDLALTAQRLSLSPRPGSRAEASLSLRLSGTWTAPLLSGDIELLRADLGPVPKPGLWRRALARLKGRRPAPAPAAPAPALPAGLAADVRVAFDRRVWYKEGATSVELRGELRLRREPREEPRLFGRVESIRGRLVYYGRTFVLHPSRLDFLGDSPPDPRVDAQALFIEERSHTRILLALSGPLSAPRIELSSQPPLEERDILSVLATGRPLDDRPRSDGSSAGQEAAEQLMASYASQNLRQHALGGLGLDVFQFRLDPERRSRLTTGRYISRDLFLTVENTFGSGALQTIKAEYTLTPVWSVEFSRTSLGSSVADLLYRKGFY